MGNQVYANGREVSCKASAGKSICAFPDVCMTPPQTPATPPGVPIPYSNTGMASDCTDGSKNVKISGEEAVLKDKSYFKKSTGDEAGSAPMRGVITHTIQGKVYFKSWSMDIKFEGENVVRHLDMTSHNHNPAPGQTPPWPHIGTQTDPKNPCKTEYDKINNNCQEKDWKKLCPKEPTHPGKKPKEKEKQEQYFKNMEGYLAEFDKFAENCKNNACINARKCLLVPYKPKSGCCPGQTGHHLIDWASFLEKGAAEVEEGVAEVAEGIGNVPTKKLKISRSKRECIDGWKKYNGKKAPCVCAEGPNQTTATHGQLHTLTGVVARTKGPWWSIKDAAETGAKAVKVAFPNSGCSEKCIQAQLMSYHDTVKDNPNDEGRIKAQASMRNDPEAQAWAKKHMGVADIDLNG